MDFEVEVSDRVESYQDNSTLMSAAACFMEASTEPKYSYNFNWMGRPIIQYPQDMVAIQEIIWKVKPDLVIETGIAHGGSLILSASMLALMDMVDAIELGEKIDPANSQRKVLGVDIDIRSHNREAIEAHPMSSRIEMIESSSTDADTIDRVRSIADAHEAVLVFLDSNHTHDHVLEELNLYAPLVTVGSYCVVFDTIIEDLPEGMFPDRSWGPGDNPKTAVHEYLKSHDEFVIDTHVDNKLLISVAPQGYLRRVR